MNVAATIFLLGQAWIILVAVCIFGLTYRNSRMKVDPSIWLSAISAGVVPCILAAFLTTVPVVPPEIVIQVKAIVSPSLFIDDAVTATSGPFQWLFAFFILYGFVVAVLFGRTGFSLFQLNRMTRSSASVILGHVHYVETDLPPCAMGWPTRAIIIPQRLKRTLSQDLLDKIITHERAHLKNRDPDVMLALTLLQHIFWVNPGLRYLVKGWRQATEIRADKVVTNKASADSRKAYATLLVTALKHNSTSSLPCPSIQLKRNNTRSITMRLTHILSLQDAMPKPIPLRRIMIGFAATSLAAGMTMTAIAADAPVRSDRDYQPIKRFPPMMPTSCPGLDTSNFVLESKSYGDVVEVGSVILSINVDTRGTVSDVKIIKSNHDCFSEAAAASVKKWQFEPKRVNGKAKPITGVEAMLKFMLTDLDAETYEAKMKELSGE